MEFLKKHGAEWSLRIGLGVMFLYSGIDIMLHPTAWTWAIRGLPMVIQNMINAIGIENYLRMQGVSEVLLAVLLLVWFLPRKVTMIVALVAALEMGGILLMVGIDAVTFRDIGLLGAGLALFFMMMPQVQARLSQEPQTNTYGTSQST